MSIPEKPTLTTPPAAPVRGEDRIEFANKANARVAWQGTNTTEMTAAIDWQNTVFTAVETEATDAATSASNSGTSATNSATSAALSQDWSIKNDDAVSGTDWSSFANAVGAAPAGSAKNWASAAEDVVVASGEYSAKHYSLKSEAYKDSAQSAAAAAGSAAGLPSLAGNAAKTLKVNPAEDGVEWSAVPQSFRVGDYLTSIVPSPPAGFLPADGSIYLQSAYPELFGAVGIRWAPDVKLPDPATLPASTGRGPAFSPDGTYLSVAHYTSPYLTIYKRSGDTFTKLPDPATLPADTGLGAAFSPDGIYLSVAHGTSPFITIYKRSGDTFTKFPDPATLPASTGWGTAFSPDGTYLSVAHDASPYIAIYSAGYNASTEFAVPVIPGTEESVHYIKAES